MRVLLICEYVSATRWAGSAWAVDICAGLSARGHRVVVACDGLDNPSVLAPGVPLLRDRPRRADHRSPLAFGRWADRLVRRGSQDVSLSLSPLAGADVWCPVEAGARAHLRRLLRQKGPASLFMGVTHKTWLPTALLAERLVTRRGSLMPIGIEPSRGGLGHASSLDPPDDRDARRRRVRDAVGVSASRPVLVMSGVHHAHGGLREMFAGLAQIESRQRLQPPILLVLGREGYSVHALARKAGCEHLVRLLGGSSRMADALVASDAGVAPLARSIDTSTGRFIADCLRLGVPVVAHPDAPGVQLLDPKRFGAAPVGITVSQGNWAEAIERMLSPGWLEPTRRAASDVGATLGMDAFITRLEHALMRHLDARPRGPFLPATRS